MKMTVATKKPKKRFSSSVEEFRRIPEEERKKILAETKVFFDNSASTFPAAIKEAVREQLESGFPITYGEEGRTLTRYPDGSIYVVNMNMTTFESTETFLRMATPEDNAGIYD